MSQVMEDEIKRWTGKREVALVLEILQGKTTVSESSRKFDLLLPSEIEAWTPRGQARDGERTPNPTGRSTVAVRAAT